MTPGRAAAFAAAGLGLLAALHLAAGGAGASRSRATSTQARPNIVVIETDDQTLESLRVMGRVRSLLADQGTTFDNSFVSFSLCCPSRATFLTGQYAHNHGVEGNNPPKGGFEKLDGRNALPVWLQRAGYWTAHIGKYLNGYGRRNPRLVPPGWSEWNGSVDPSTYRYYQTTINHDGRLQTTGTDPASYQTDVYARLAKAIIARRAPSAQPFFLWTAFLAPHTTADQSGDESRGTPPIPAPRDRGRFSSEPLPATPALDEADVADKPVAVRRVPLLGPAALEAIRGNYDRALETLLAVDDAVAAIVGALRDAGELDDTLIVFTSDNGYFYGEHRIPFGKLALYEPSIRVPLVLRGPGVPRAVHRSQPVANVDLAPTILDAAGATPGRVQDGESLLPLAADPGRDHDRDILIEDGRRSDLARVYTAIRTPRYLYAEYANGDRELYDLDRDPYQLDSRAADPAYAAARATLAARLHALRGCRGAGCRTGGAVPGPSAG